MRRGGLSFTDFKNGLASLKNPLLLAVLLGIVFHTLGLDIQGPYLAICAEDVFSVLPAHYRLDAQRAAGNLNRPLAGWEDS